ncbi:hypothetical protein J6590_037304 [Homalodisca vitripennis]|nr:hypothetical protein J6590_037304 [Homalodisca vitripennis]
MNEVMYESINGSDRIPISMQYSLDRVVLAQCSAQCVVNTVPLKRAAMSTPSHLVRNWRKVFLGLQTLRKLSAEELIKVDVEYEMLASINLINVEPSIGVRYYVIMLTRNVTF